jgi:hypothetical protein
MGPRNMAKRVKESDFASAAVSVVVDMMDHQGYVEGIENSTSRF